MSLTLYKKKRSFNKTPEPSGKKKVSGRQLRFVVQKHDASHLHYDFRLEMEGVLKSWAVPKGPSTDPDIKRLAMMVEDHPYDYRNFEGIIPEGNYGAGTVMVWDEGTYEAADENGHSKKSADKALLHQLYSGKLKFILHGTKLKGEFALVKAQGRGDNAWLLMKLNDKYASKEDITQKDKSVLSKKTLAQIASTSKNFYQSNRSKSTAKSSSKKKSKTTKTKKAAKKSTKHISEETSELLSKARKTPMPTDIKPMLATLVDKPFDNENWLYEIKWDGYRAVSYLYNGTIEIRSRNNLLFNDKFKPVTEALKNWEVNAVIDGEIVAIDENGHADFQQLQGYAKNANKAELLYYVFDLIWYDGKNLTGLPLIDRKRILKEICPEEQSVIRYSDHIVGNGKAFFNEALKQGLEGVMAKKMDSEYTTGFRSNFWLKIKSTNQLEAIICGFTEPRRSRKLFGAIILGKYDGDELKYIGHSGSGFNDKSLKEAYKKFQPLITDKCPFKVVPKTNMPVTWLKPKLVCEVKYSEWTEEKILRHPIFSGLREDKEASQEKNEKIAHAPSTKTSNKKPMAAKTKEIAKPRRATKTSSAKQTTGKQLLPADSKEEIIKMKGHELTFTNLNKIYWPKEKISKRDVLNYYYEVMPYILPYMKDRPQSLNRHPNGINGPNFFQKNVEGKVADWIETYAYKSESDGQVKQFLVCADEATLMYMANLGCIEMNPWHSRIRSPDQPDWCVIDLDPDGNPFDQVIEAALAVKKILDSIKVTAYCKTSGATGMHIYIPLGAAYSYDQSRMFAELIVQLVHQQIPSFTSVERNPSKRKKKIYLDYLQNRSIQTIAAPYSLRPKPGATVSAPLHWEELKKGLTPQQFTIYNIQERIKAEGDPFRPVLGKGIDLEEKLKKMNSILS